MRDVAFEMLHKLTFSNTRSMAAHGRGVSCRPIFHSSTCSSKSQALRPEPAVRTAIRKSGIELPIFCIYAYSTSCDILSGASSSQNVPLFCRSRSQGYAARDKAYKFSLVLSCRAAVPPRRTRTYNVRQKKGRPIC